MRYKVAQIIPYFGRWPEWIELYFYSCGRNPMVDFIFYTDCPLPKHQYSNTKFHQCTFEEYKALVSERLGIDYNIKSAYKLTDLKPFQGAIHEPELREYDFWGFSDLDLVYGDLTLVVNEKNLDKNDLITTHSYHIAGHFTLCRNNEYYRNLCFKLRNWQEGLVEDKHHAYDEGEWSDLVYPKLRYVRKIHRLFCKPLGIHYFKTLSFFNPFMARKCHFKEYYTSPNPGSGGTDGSLWSYNTKTSEVLREGDKLQLPYLHFLFFKKTPWFETDNYWRDGYYQIGDEIDSYNVIYFNYKSISAQYGT